VNKAVIGTAIILWVFRELPCGVRQYEAYDLITLELYP